MIQSFKPTIPVAFLALAENDCCHGYDAGEAI
jgi:hypothetical protein